MEDSKIDAIAREVLTTLRKSRAATPPSPPSPAPAQATATEDKATIHPSFRLLSVVGGVLGSPCIIEPDKPCVGSLKCRTFGH